MQRGIRSLLAQACITVKCGILSQSSAGYCHNQCGYQAGVVQLLVWDTKEHSAVYTNIISGYHYDLYDAV